MSRISRRQFVSAVGAAAAGLAIGRNALGENPASAPASGPASAPLRRPNILLIMADEHDPAVTGCYGDTLVRTPHLDRLAGGGITFDAAYTTSPLCVPARMSFISGKYISQVGAWSNTCRLPSADYPSLPRVLATVGYQSYLAGKMHLDRTHRYGYEELYATPQNRFNMRGTGERRKVDDTTPVVKAWADRAKDFHTGDTSHTIANDMKVTQACGDFLAARRATDKPFFLTVGYLAPHFPLTVPAQYYEHYKGKVPMPRMPEGFLEGMPTNYKHLRYGFGLTAATPEQIQMGRDLYYGLVEWFDDQVDQLLSALGDSEVADNTIVIYTADHGENRGEHGLWWKNCMYEQAARVPLIVRWPKRWRGGQRRSGACSMVDVTRTIAEMAGAKTPADWNGDSLLLYMDNARTRWKDAAVSEYYGHNIASGFAMIRQGSWKYVYHNRMDNEHGPERELYDLKEDPGEVTNLANRPDERERIAAMHAALCKELGEDPEKTELRCRADYAKGYAPTASRPAAAAS